MEERCLSYSEAKSIVLANCPVDYPDINQTLEQIGLITPSQRAAFRAGVRNGVEALGCIVDPHVIPSDANTVLRDVAILLVSMSRRPPGDPTTPPPPPRKRR